MADPSGLCLELGKLLEVDEKAGSMGVFVAYTIAWCSENFSSKNDPLKEDVEKLLELVKNRYRVETLKEDPVVRCYRKFYWRIGIDPTKTRPSSEALVRRCLRGSFPRINPVVDAGNIASAETMVPIGLYDLSRAKPPFKITLSRGGEVFKPIGGKPETLEEGLPILLDSMGTVMHLYPHRDSVETMIREDTRTILVIGAGVPGVPENLVKQAVTRVAKLLEKLGWSWCGIVETSP